MGARTALLTLIPLLLTISRPKAENNLKNQAISLTVIGILITKNTPKAANNLKNQAILLTIMATSITAKEPETENCLKNLNLKSLKDCRQDDVMNFDVFHGFPLNKVQGCDKHEENRCYLLEFIKAYNFSDIQLITKSGNPNAFKIQVVNKSGILQQWIKGTGPWSTLMIDSSRNSVLCHMTICVYDNLKKANMLEETTAKVYEKQNSYATMFGTIPTMFGFGLFCVFLYTMRYISKKKVDSTTEFVATSKLRNMVAELDFTKKNNSVRTGKFSIDSRDITEAIHSLHPKKAIKMEKLARISEDNESNIEPEADTFDAALEEVQMHKDSVIVDSRMNTSKLGSVKKKKKKKHKKNNILSITSGDLRKELENKTVEEIAEELTQMGYLDDSKRGE